MRGEDVGSSALSLISLYEISKILSSSLDLEKTFLDVLNLLSSYLQMRRGVVALADGRGEVRLAAVNGLSRDAVRRGACGYPLQALKRVIDTSMPSVISNAHEDPLFADYLPPTEDGQVVSVIAVPIKGSDRTYGALSIERPWDGGVRFSFETDVRFLTMVSNLMAQTVRLHQSVASDRERLLEERARLQKALERETTQELEAGVAEIIGDSPAMQRVYSEIRLVAPSRSTVLLRGESGTGKELVARAIHALSPRKDRPFIKVNCAALPETLLESELFGHERGAFTGATSERKGRFEMASGGTLFLDEIGEISPSFQAKLLRILQEGEFERVGGTKTIRVDVRLISATNKNLEEAVAAGDFRADLYYRINVVPVFLPPLREREGDIPRLARHFLERFNEDNGRRLDITADAMNVFANCHFPGNVRELENCVQRVATMTRGEIIRDVDLPCQRNNCLSAVLWSLDAGANPTGGLGRVAAQPPRPQRPATPAAPEDEEFFDDDGGEGFDDGPEPLTGGTAVPQRDRLISAMERAGWVQAKAARILGLTPRQVGYALKKYNIEVKRI
ncbi:nif-specific transcriptional activator NifA [Novispirillum sp. DQ9]|uniref:nif-specific transcriptional activator NifA n=1 Tax=Novispirillum sp. DQ9 TaxID=3398612 RepID=UPI003C7CD46A